VAGKPTITVTADPDALKAAMEALEAYSKAAEAYEATEAAALGRLKEAQAKANAAYAETIGKAKGKLDEAQKAAKAAGVNFPEGSTTKKSAKAASGSRSPRMSLEEVEAKLPDGDFKLSDLEGPLGRPAPTIRNYLMRLIEVGKVAEVGEDSSGRGKPAKIYSKA